MLKILPWKINDYLDNISKLASLYIISGDEPLQKDEAIAFIIAKAHQCGFSEQINHFIDGPYDFSIIQQDIENFSLFSESRIIKLEFSYIPQDKQFITLLSLISDYKYHDTIFLIGFPKLITKYTKTNWYKKLYEKAVVITVWPITGEAFRQWLLKQLKIKRLTATENALNLLVERLEGNLPAAKQSVNKLSLLFDKVLDVEEVNTAICDLSSYDVFNFIDVLLQADIIAVLHQLETLKKKAIEPILILWSLIQTVRIIMIVLRKQALGLSFNLAFEQSIKINNLSFGVFKKKMMLYKNASNKLNEKKARNLLVFALKIDIAIKSLHQQDIWQLIDHYTLAFCNIKNLPDIELLIK